jgi:hypothetical protein
MFTQKRDMQLRQYIAFVLKYKKSANFAPVIFYDHGFSFRYKISFSEPCCVDNKFAGRFEIH